MEKNKAPLFTFSIIAIIVGVALYKQFDFETLKFQKTGLAIVYMVVFIASIYIIIKGLKDRQQQQGPNN
jgi:uncharacterized membrane protein YuzA (DUF378 family)